MPRKKKTYLDMFLDNSENSTKKKKKKGEKYFDEAEEWAILKFNDPETSENEKRDLFNNVIDPGFKKIADSILDMPKFHNLPRGLSREQLVDDAYYRLVEKISKFTPDKIGESGQPVKAFSYFSTIAKNFVLEKKVRFEKILKNKADVESSIDLSILSEDTLQKMSNYDKMDVHLDDYETMFNDTRMLIIKTVQDVIDAEEKKNKRDEDFIKIGYYLKYLLEHWNKIEFMKKNEFMRILTLYTGLKQQQVSFHFKKFKNAVLKKLRPNGIIKTNSVKLFKDDEEEMTEEMEDDLMKESDEDEFIENTDSEEDDKPKRFRYGINTMEEFEISLEFDDNFKYKNKYKKNE